MLEQRCLCHEKVCSGVITLPFIMMAVTMLREYKLRQENNEIGYEQLIIKVLLQILMNIFNTSEIIF